MDLFDIIKYITPVVSESPLTFEDLKLNHGFILYETKILFKSLDPAVLSIPDIKDRAHRSSPPAGVSSSSELRENECANAASRVRPGPS